MEKRPCWVGGPLDVALSIEPHPRAKMAKSSVTRRKVKNTEGSLRYLSRESSSYPFVKRGARRTGYGIVTMKFASVGNCHCRSRWKSRPALRTSRTKPPRMLVKIICTKSLAIAGELTVNGPCRMESDFIIYRCVPAVSFRTLWTCHKLV